MSRLFKIKTKIRRNISRALGFDRPSSYPYITGDGFRCLAQHVFDDISDIDPSIIEKNDVVFVRSDLLKDFFADKHPNIKHEYILVSHNDDTNIDASYATFIDEKIIHWFAQNLIFRHPKATPVPIGVANFRYHSKGKLHYFDQKVITKEGVMSIRYGFSMFSSTERILAEKNLSKSPLAKKIEVKDQDDYIETIKNSYYIASPAGRGIDCHRTWEAIYLRAVPIVLRNPMTDYFKSIGLPMLLIDSWDDVKDLTKEYLEKEYEKMYKDDKFPQAFMDYWQKEIDKLRK
jgi:hypothetical protein